ncbi:MAG: CopG family transcriptional regulator [bacterium]
MLTLRIDDTLINAIETTAKKEGITKSDLIRRSITAYISKHMSADPYEAGKAYFGKYDSKNPNLSRDSEKLLKSKFRNK